MLTIHDYHVLGYLTIYFFDHTDVLVTCIIISRLTCRTGAVIAAVAKHNTRQHNAIKCNTLQHTTTHCNIHAHCTLPAADSKVQHTATHCNTLQHTATHCNTPSSPRTPKCVAVCMLQCVCCSVLQCVAVCCSVLQ